MKYAVMFTEPTVRADGRPTMQVFAGLLSDGALGIAPTLATAELFDDREAAERILENGYGEEMRDIGTVVTVIGEPAGRALLTNVAQGAADEGVDLDDAIFAAERYGQPYPGEQRWETADPDVPGSRS